MLEGPEYTLLTTLSQQLICVYKNSVCTGVQSSADEAASSSTGSTSKAAFFPRNSLQYLQYSIARYKHFIAAVCCYQLFEYPRPETSTKF